MALSWDKVTWFPNGTNQGSIMFIGGAAGDHMVNGLKTTDQIANIEAVEFGAGVPTDVHNLKSEFTISEDDTLNNAGGTDTTGMLVVLTLVLSYREGSDFDF